MFSCKRIYNEVEHVFACKIVYIASWDNIAPWDSIIGETCANSRYIEVMGSSLVFPGFWFNTFTIHEHGEVLVSFPCLFLVTKCKRIYNEIEHVFAFYIIP